MKEVKEAGFALLWWFFPGGVCEKLIFLVIATR